MAKTNKPAASPTSHPPYLKRVHLRNAPPLRDLKADFKPGLNIIIGKNGSGKTRFLDMVKQITEPYLKKYNTNGCELVLVVDSQEVSINFEEQIEAPTDDSSFQNYMPGGRRPLTVVTTSGVKTQKNETLKRALDPLFSSTIMPYRIVPLWHGIPVSTLLPIVDTDSDLVLTQEELKLTNISRWSIDSWLLRSMLRTIEDSRQSNITSYQHIDAARAFINDAINVHIDILNAYLPLYSPIKAVRCSDRFKVYANNESDEIIIKGLALEYEMNNDWLPFSALSDGTKRIFYLIGEMVSEMIVPPNSRSKDFTILRGGCIVLLEEPELGIHPDQLQLLLQFIREVSQKYQVIMTTHSPQTLDMLSGQELDRITICEYIPGKGTQMRKLSAAKKAKAKAYLKDKGFLSEFWRFSNLEDPD